MPMLRRARLIANGLTGFGFVALLAACGSAPEATNTVAAAPDNEVSAVNAMNAAENAANETAPDNVVVNSAKPTPTPTPSASPTPTAAATPEPKLAPAAAAGDAANGAKLFAQCKICHSTEPGKNGLGPSLHGIVGSKAADVAGFNFSPAMKASGLTWTDATLSDYLIAPMKKVPGTKMAFAGVANEKNRADIIAYLNTLK